MLKMVLIKTDQNYTKIRSVWKKKYFWSFIFILEYYAAYHQAYAHFLLPSKNNIWTGASINDAIT